MIRDHKSLPSTALLEKRRNLDAIRANIPCVKLEITLSDEVVAEIDAITADRSAFIAAAVARVLGEARRMPVSDSREDNVPLSTTS